MHIRCIAHVINIVVQCFLHAIDEAADPDIEDWYELCKDAEIHYDIDEDEDQQLLKAEEIPDTEDPENIEMGNGIEEKAEDDLDKEEVDSIEEIGSKGAVTRVRPSLFLGEVYYLISTFFL